MVKNCVYLLSSKIFLLGVSPRQKKIADNYYILCKWTEFVELLLGGKKKAITLAVISLDAKIPGSFFKKMGLQQ